MLNIIGVLLVLFVVFFVVGSTLYVLGWMPLVLAFDWIREQAGQLRKP